MIADDQAALRRARGQNRQADDRGGDRARGAR
jgi:hypothetical protein